MAARHDVRRAADTHAENFSLDILPSVDQVHELNTKLAMHRLFNAQGICLPTQITVHTREGSEIANEQCWTPCSHNALRAVLEKHRPPSATYLGSASPVYNCHGLTFASRRTAINSSLDDQLRNILQEDGYTEVPRERAQCGDVVLYLDADSSIEHSGIVIEALPFGDYRVWSKWGSGPEMSHRLADCPYDSRFNRFYRITK